MEKQNTTIAQEIINIFEFLGHNILTPENTNWALENIKSLYQKEPHKKTLKEVLYYDDYNYFRHKLDSTKYQEIYDLFKSDCVSILSGPNTRRTPEAALDKFNEILFPDFARMLNAFKDLESDNPLQTFKDKSEKSKYINERVIQLLKSHPQIIKPQITLNLLEQFDFFISLPENKIIKKFLIDSEIINETSKLSISQQLLDLYSNNKFYEKFEIHPDPRIFLFKVSSEIKVLMKVLEEQKLLDKSIKTVENKTSVAAKL